MLKLFINTSSYGSKTAILTNCALVSHETFTPLLQSTSLFSEENSLIMKRSNIMLHLTV